MNEQPKDWPEEYAYEDEEFYDRRPMPIWLKLLIVGCISWGIGILTIVWGWYD